MIVTQPLTLRRFAIRFFRLASVVCIAFSGLQIAADFLNHDGWVPAHLLALGASTTPAIAAAVLQQRLLPIFASVTYGLLFPSIFWGMGLGPYMLITGTHSHDVAFVVVVFACLAVMVLTVSSIVLIKRWEQGHPDAI